MDEQNQNSYLTWLCSASRVKMPDRDVVLEYRGGIDIYTRLPVPVIAQGAPREPPVVHYHIDHIYELQIFAEALVEAERAAQPPVGAEPLAWSGPSLMWLSCMINRLANLNITPSDINMQKMRLIERWRSRPIPERLSLRAVMADFGEASKVWRHLAHIIDAITAQLRGIATSLAAIMQAKAAALQGNSQAILFTCLCDALTAQCDAFGDPLA